VLITVSYLYLLFDTYTDVEKSGNSERLITILRSIAITGLYVAIYLKGMILKAYERLLNIKVPIHEHRRSHWREKIGSNFPHNKIVY